MSLEALSLAFILVGLVLMCLRSHFSYWAKRGVPCEPPLYIIGNLRGIGRTVHFRDVNRRIYERFKHSAPIAGVYLFFSRALLILDLDLIKQVLIKDFANFHDRGLFHNVRDDPLTGHLLTLEGEQWRAMRHKMTPVFTSGKMKFMFPTIVNVADKLVTACGAQMSDSSNVIEVKELSARFTTDVIGTCAFGIECNSLQDPDAEFRQRGRSIFGDPRHSQAMQAFMLTNPKVARRMRLKFFNDHVSDFFIDAVKRTVDYRVKNGIKRNDFMDLLIEMMAPDQELAAQGDGIDLSHGLTLLQMAAQAFVFFVAGFDTSSTTMSFCLYELAMNPDIQEKLRAEIKSVLTQHNDELTYESVSDMHYLDQVFSEILRKYPVLPHLVRKTKHDFQVPNSNYVIPKGTTIFIPIHNIHHDADIYPEPEKFNPARFEAQAVEKRHSCAYLPFGDGPRNCIGNRFGKMQAKVGLIALLKHYKFSKTPLTEEQIVLDKRNFIIAAENGIHLHVELV